MATTKFSKIKKGEYFKFVGKQKVYTYQGKARCYDKWGTYKGWGYCYTDEYRDYRETMTDRDIEIGFDY